MTSSGRRHGFVAPARAVVTLFGTVAATMLIGAVLPVGDASAGRGTTLQTATTTTTTTSAPENATDPGRVAYVTPSGDVVVADSDGSNPRVIGSGAASNSQGLAPLAWHQPGAESVTYVRNDHALVDAPVNGSKVTILARDAVVPPEASENILSWQLSGTFLAYVAEPVAGRFEPRLIDFTKADETHPPEIRTTGDPDRRRILEQAFSPIDPFLYQRTTDRETGREFTISIVEPIGGAPFASPFSLDDPAFAPDGRFVYAVATVGAMDQLVRISIGSPSIQPISDHDRICRPSVSPDARKVVFAAGPSCQELWIVDADGRNPHRIAEQVGGTASFVAGNFSWSLDGQVISHAACKQQGDRVACGGGYWDISVDGRTIKPRALAGSVLREQRALVRSVKATIALGGPISYNGSMQVGGVSVGPLIDRGRDEQVDIKATDENDPRRSFAIKLYHPPGGATFAGSITIVDGAFNETFMLMARALPQSFGRATIRAIWFRTEKFPIAAGQMTLRLER